MKGHLRGPINCLCQFWSDWIINYKYNFKMSQDSTKVISSQTCLIFNFWVTSFLFFCVIMRKCFIEEDNQMRFVWIFALWQNQVPRFQRRAGELLHKQKTKHVHSIRARSNPRGTRVNLYGVDLGLLHLPKFINNLSWPLRLTPQKMQTKDFFRNQVINSSIRSL